MTFPSFFIITLPLIQYLIVNVPTSPDLKFSVYWNSFCSKHSFHLLCLFLTLAVSLSPFPFPLPASSYCWKFSTSLSYPASHLYFSGIILVEALVNKSPDIRKKIPFLLFLVSPHFNLAWASQSDSLSATQFWSFNLCLKPAVTKKSPSFSSLARWHGHTRLLIWYQLPASLLSICLLHLLYSP